MSEKSKKNPSFIKILRRGIILLIVVLLIAVISFFTYLNIKKNDISEDLLRFVNKELKGDFSVSGISLGSLFSYPDLEITVKGLRFHAPSGPITHRELILEVKRLKLKADLSDILSKQILVQDVFITGAKLYIERDSAEQMVIGEGFKPSHEQATATDSTKLIIDIRNILIKDSEVVIIDRPTNLELPFKLDNVKGTFKLNDKLIQGVADIDLLPLNFEQIKAFYLNKLPINLVTNYSVDIDKELVMVKGKELYIGDEHYSVNYHYNYTEKPFMDFQLASLDAGVNLSTLFVEEMDSIDDNQKIELLGQGQFRTDLHWKPDSKKPFFEAIKAGFVLEGRNLKIYGMDLDNVIEKFKRSQEFNLADVSAVMFAGPAGLAVTKGTDFARLAFAKAGDSTQVKHFLADWRMNKGLLTAEDVALSTNKNLVSTSGWYNVRSDSLDFKINILDKRGCELVSQQISGDALNPEYGKVKLLKTFLGPVKNFFRNMGITKCDTLYIGKVEHPSK
ncbi:AsmA family protein [Lutimonas halocynthiae]|uniref:AsmA family protein n=1 Tax=Lutimonas halocynthiae TaxID=1446477 RepID=UPI0025B3C43F|nr:AsmA family protein [Lutimonas halocynthiae]MDN3642495.1 AsmA family protein [Lutimonas halocynthiae]